MNRRDTAFPATGDIYIPELPHKGLSFFLPILPATQAHPGEKAYNSIQACRELYKNTHLTLVNGNGPCQF